ncbi:MAG TPA: HD domain-containing phosphohydrolase [Gemmatimonadaceae bacterium]|nr:HD domain-containing phosphohydrolase [Gemmatimonadaceae bacterium]
MSRLQLVPLAAGLAAGALLIREHAARRAAERFGAASLEALLDAVEANDPETGAHVRRVADYALVIARALELDTRAQRAVERVALFHDIGKIHEALFDVVHETHRLTPKQRRAIATHPQRGAEVLQPLCGFYPELPAGVLAHHECWDGSGYPRKLAGTRIPLAARIVALADTFDAVSHSRRYRAGQGIEAAAEVIAKGRGTQFDPELVDLFLLPPVLDDLCRRARAAHRPRRRERRHGEQERFVPDVTFRWRREAPAPPARGREPRTAPG